MWQRSMASTDAKERGDCQNCVNPPIADGPGTCRFALDLPQSDLRTGACPQSCQSRFTTFTVLRQFRLVFFHYRCQLVRNAAPSDGTLSKRRVY